MRQSQASVSSFRKTCETRQQRIYLLGGLSRHIRKFGYSLDDFAWRKNLQELARLADAGKSVLIFIAGLILPARDDVPMIGEYPRKDEVVYTFGTVRKTEEYRAAIESGLGEEVGDKKQIVSDRVMDEIYSLGYDPRKLTPLLLLKYNPYAIAAVNAYHKFADGMEQGLIILPAKTISQFAAKISVPVAEKTRSFREALKSFFD